MLITPRTYFASQTPDHAFSRVEGASRFYTLAGWRQSPVDARSAAEMLLIHQVGSVRVGEVARSVPKTPCSQCFGSGLFRIASVCNDALSSKRLTYINWQIHFDLHTSCRSDPAHSVRTPCEGEEFVRDPSSSRVPPWPIYALCSLLPLQIRPQ